MLYEATLEWVVCARWRSQVFMPPQVFTALSELTRKTPKWWKKRCGDAGKWLQQRLRISNNNKAVNSNFLSLLYPFSYLLPPLQTPAFSAFFTCFAADTLGGFCGKDFRAGKLDSAASQLSEESQFMNLLATWLSTKHTAHSTQHTPSTKQQAAKCSRLGFGLGA